MFILLSGQAAVAILFFLLLIYIWYRLFFDKKPRPIIPFPKKWQKILLSKVRYYRQLSADDRKRFEQDILALLDSITITGVETKVTDTDKMLVAASGVIPIFGFPEWQYRNLNEVLLYKGTFNKDYETEGKERNVLGMVGEGVMNRMMILSKPALHQGFENRRTKSNVGIHEFVHLLDKKDGDIDGIPQRILDQQYVIPWMNMVHEEINEIKRGKSNINPYGATNQAEFFSVISEYFFNQPLQLERDHPELFDLLEKIFRQELG